MKARISIRLKPAILDPQGKTVQQALQQMGYTDVNTVRIGKLVELDIAGNDPAEVRKQVEDFSRKLLTNPLMETFEIELGRDAG